MINYPISTTQELTNYSTEELKQQLIQLAQPRDGDSLSQKNQFYQTTLSPIFEALAKRNPITNVKEQAHLIVGVWMPVWSTIPFQDMLPGRRREQSYQIFREDGYYANIARYTPGMELPLLRNFSFNPLVYDLMLIQKYEINQQQWQIENVSIKQAVRVGASKLTHEKAQAWFDKVMASPLDTSQSGAMTLKLPFSKKAKQKASKQLQGATKAKPKLEHLYMDDNFRLVKSQRESKQRPSYTITIRAEESNL